MKTGVHWDVVGSCYPGLRKRPNARVTSAKKKGISSLKGLELELISSSFYDNSMIGLEDEMSSRPWNNRELGHKPWATSANKRRVLLLELTNELQLTQQGQLHRSGHQSPPKVMAQSCPLLGDFHADGSDQMQNPSLVNQ